MASAELGGGGEMGMMKVCNGYSIRTSLPPQKPLTIRYLEIVVFLDLGFGMMYASYIVIMISAVQFLNLQIKNQHLSNALNGNRFLFSFLHFEIFAQELFLSLHYLLYGSFRCGFRLKIN